MDARERLIEKIRRQGDPDDRNTPNPVVSLEDFFEGNDDVGSIGCNLNDHPGIDFFYQTLKAVRARESVQDVLIRINTVEDMWPFSDVVYIITSSSVAQVQDWLASLHPDEVGEGRFLEARLANDPVLLPGMNIIYAWWD